MGRNTRYGRKHTVTPRESKYKKAPQGVINLGEIENYPPHVVGLVSRMQTKTKLWERFGIAQEHLDELLDMTPEKFWEAGKHALGGNDNPDHIYGHIANQLLRGYRKQENQKISQMLFREATDGNEYTHVLNGR